jgi:hypothetical protein
MPQQLADLAQGGAVTQHLGGQSMTELMGSRGGRIDTGTLERVPNDRSNGTRTEKAAEGSSGA